MFEKRLFATISREKFADYSICIVLYFFFIFLSSSICSINGYSGEYVCGCNVTYVNIVQAHSCLPFVIVQKKKNIFENKQINKKQMQEEITQNRINRKKLQNEEEKREEK